MFIFFIRKNKTGEQTRRQKNDAIYSREHNEDMKKFRLSHLQESTRETVITVAGHILANIKTTKLNKFIQN